MDNKHSSGMDFPYKCLLLMQSLYRMPGNKREEGSGPWKETRVGLTLFPYQHLLMIAELPISTELPVYHLKLATANEPFQELVRFNWQTIANYVKPIGKL